MTYGELKALVASYMHRSDLTDVVDDFVEQARTRINRDARLGEMLVRTTVTPTENPWTVPADFLEARELSYFRNGHRVPLRLSPRWQMNLYDNVHVLQSNPQFYSVDGSKIETRPGGIGVEFSLLYFAELAKFTDDSDTNAVLSTFPSIYLYGALIEAFSWTQDNELRAAATETYVSEVNLANTKAREAELGAAMQMTGASSWL